MNENIDFSDLMIEKIKERINLMSDNELLILNALMFNELSKRLKRIEDVFIKRDEK